MMAISILLEQISAQVLGIISRLNCAKMVKFAVLIHLTLF